MKLILVGCFLTFVSVSLGTSSDGYLKVRVSTWNVGESKPPKDLNDFLGFNGGETADILAIGLEETAIRNSLNVFSWKNVTLPWINALDNVGSSNGYERVAVVHLGSMFLGVYVKYEHYGNLADSSTGFLGTGPFPIIEGNKGGVGVNMTLYDKTFLFIDSHLPAHEGHYKDRIRDAEKVWLMANGIDNAAKDYTFWFGDLNFRLEDGLSWDEVVQKIQSGDLASLKSRDELKRAIKLGEGFEGFSEMDINFNPTFKFKSNSDKYKTSRRPAWTDRILYKAASRSGIDIKPVVYNSLPQARLSDHRPVFAEFLVKVK